MEFLSLLAPVVQIFKCASPSVETRYDNFSHYEEHIEKLRSKVDDLKNLRKDVQSKVDAAEKNLDSISQVVKAWLGKVDLETNKDIETMVGIPDGETMEMINIKGWRGWRFSRRRYSAGKEAQKQLIIILNLLLEGYNITDVSVPSQLLSSSLNNRNDHVSSPLPPLPPTAGLPERGSNCRPKNVATDEVPPPRLPDKGRNSRPKNIVTDEVPPPHLPDEGSNYRPKNIVTFEVPPPHLPDERSNYRPKNMVTDEVPPPHLPDEGSNYRPKNIVTDEVNGIADGPNPTRPLALQPIRIEPSTRGGFIPNTPRRTGPRGIPPRPRPRTPLTSEKMPALQPIPIKPTGGGFIPIPSLTSKTPPALQAIPIKPTGGVFIPVPPRPPMTSTKTPRAYGNSEEFKSRKQITESVMDALKEVGTYIVGVYGIGGAGKTMLMKQVSERVKEHKMFDVVIVVTVSKVTDLSASDVDLKRIQGEIAKSLGFNRIEELDEIPKRAEMLCKRLMNEERVLVILDDVWTTEILELSDVGIPCGENYPHKGYCKVAFTTRSLEVCNLLNSDRNIEVGMLSKQESWNLFKENIGELAVTLAPATVAKLVKECGGLPLVLVTVGRALRNKDVHVLDAAALKLETSSYFGAKRDGKIKSKVYSSIKLSYDQLEDETLKTYFLFCSCFPEDYRISTNELMMHVMGDDEILEDIKTLKQARSRLHALLDKLMASCLLLGEKQNDGEISYVYMHDIIRDVALLIASEEGNGFFIKSGASLKCWPNISLLQRSISGKCLRLSLIRNDISKLPDKTPEFPHLLSLSMKENISLKRIPDNFFQEMKALTTLDLSRTGIQSLPSSLSGLVNLYTLCLDNCNFNRSVDISVIGKLKELRLLSLENCNLLRLPEEIGELINLKLLNLSKNNSLTVIPPNVMSNLICLEELYMRSSFDAWEYEGLRKYHGNNANLEEVASLPCLTTLHLKAFKNFTAENPASKEIIEFEVSFGRESEHNDPMSFDPKRNQFSCHLTVSYGVPWSIMVLLPKVDSLELIKCRGFVSVDHLLECSSKTVRLDSLKSLFVKECSDMEYLIAIGFPNLKYLFLHSLGITDIVDGQIPSGCLQNLKLLQVKSCGEICNIFDHHLARSVINLEELNLEDCFSLTEVVNCNRSRRESDGLFIRNNAGLPNLRRMSLRHLPRLQTIWRGRIPHESLANLKIVTIFKCNKLKHMFSPDLAWSLQNLEELLISDCGGMENLLDHSPTTTSPPVFPNLKKLFIKECNSLQYLFSSTDGLDGGGLSRLEELDIWDCKNLKNVIRDEEAKDDDQVVHVLRFPELSTLRLTTLPKLSNFHQGLSELEFPSLQNVTIVRCLKLKKLPLTHSSAIHLTKIVGDSMKWFEEFTWEELTRVRAEEKQEDEMQRQEDEKRRQEDCERERLRPYFEETPWQVGSIGFRRVEKEEDTRLIGSESAAQIRRRLGMTR